MNRIIPVVMVEGALSDAARQQSTADHHSHHAADDPSQPMAGPAPAFLHVAGKPISEAQVAREMQHHRADNPHQARADAARALVVRELLRLEAERLEIAEGIEQIDGETLEEACIRVLLEREVPVPAPDENACLRYYENNREQLHHPDRLRVRHILLAAAPADASARSRVSRFGEELIASLQQHPERFAEFAMRHSACPSRDDGGDLGWIERGQTTPEFDRQLFRLKPGLAGLTVETRYGHHVVYLDQILRGEALTYAEAAGKIAAYLETQVRQNAIHQYLQNLQAQHQIVGLES